MKVYAIKWGGEIVSIHLTKYGAHSDYRWERKDLREGMEVESFYLTPTGEVETAPLVKEEKEENV